MDEKLFGEAEALLWKCKQCSLCESCVYFVNCPGMKADCSKCMIQKRLDEILAISYRKLWGLE